MRARHLGAVIALLVVGAVVLAGPSVGLGADFASSVEQVDNGTAENDSESEAAFGEQVSSFAQSSASDANHTMDTGLWNASVSSADDPTEPVRQRVGQLEQRIDRLESRIADLDAQRENMSDAEYNARASALRAELSNLRDAIDQTNETARRVGVNAENLDTLRNAASNMTGPEVAALARNITDAPRGPPEDAGPSDNPGQGNGTDQGQSDDRGQNDGDQGQSDNPGQNDGNQGANDGNQGGDSENGQGGGGNGPAADDDDDDSDDGGNDSPGSEGGGPG